MNEGFWQEDLDAFLGDPLPEGEEEVPPPADAQQCDWLLRKGMRLETQIREIRELHDAERARIDAWMEDRTSGAERQLRRIEALVEAFARPALAEARSKTLDLPHGTIRLRAQKGRVVVTNEDDLKAWALKTGHDELIRVKVEVDKTTISKLDKTEPAEAMNDGEVGTAALFLTPGDETGTEIPGVIFFKPALDSFSFELAKEMKP